MTDTNPVRKVQQHLRRAGALLSEHQYDAASAEVDAALMIDPASLPAQALRERIVTMKDRASARAAAGSVDAGEPQTAAPQAQEKRFVPNGVDAQTWLGFEQRIQERRFRALLDQVETAITQQDGIAARMALEEARELRPEAPELADANARVVLLPMAMPSAESNGYLWSRAAGAVALLFVGIGALLGLEWMRPVSAPDLTTPAAVVQPHDLTAPTPGVAAPVATAPVTPADNAPAPTEIAVPESIPPVSAQPVPTVGIRRAVSIERPVQAGPAVRTFRPADESLVEPRLSPRNGEIPDDYVAPEYRHPSYQGRAAAAPITSPVTAAVNAPVTTAAAVVPPPSRPAASLAPVVAPIPSGRLDESRVTQVLNQYARAYRQLDASAARAVWPSVNERALARAFASLESQSVSFDACDVNVSGATATASCRGRASYVGKIGSREPRTEQRQWTFELKRDGNDAWKIENAQAQRLAYAQ